MISWSNYQHLEVSKFMTTNTDQKYILSYHGNYYEINQNTAEFITILKNSKSSEDIVHYYRLKNKHYTKNDIRTILTNIIDPILTSTPESKHFIWKRKLNCDKYINTLSKLFAFLFDKRYCTLFLSIALGLNLYFIINHSFINIPNHIDFFSLISIVTFFIISSFFHEVGHISACKYYNINPNGIGIGLYLNFPVLYSNISQIWTLNRNRRLVVNISGIYFQLILLIPVLIFYFITNSNICHYCIIIINLNILITLNPFFKFDGYWIMTDILGIPNLKQRTNEYMKYIIISIFKKPAQKPFILTTPFSIVLTTTIYTVLVNLFMLYYFIYLIPKFINHFIQTYPRIAEECFLQIINGELPSFQTLQSFVCEMIIFILIIYMILRFILLIIKKCVYYK